MTVGLLALTTVLLFTFRGDVRRAARRTRSRFCRCTGTSWMRSGSWSSRSSTSSGAKEEEANGCRITEPNEVRKDRSKCPRRPRGRSCWRLDVTLLFAGLVTSGAVSILGAIVAIAGAVGWFRDVLPHEAHESVPVRPEAAGRHDGATRSGAGRRSRTSCRARGCRWRSIRFPRASRAVSPGAWRWRLLAMLYGLLSATRHLVSDQSAGRRIFSRAP